MPPLVAPPTDKSLANQTIVVHKTAPAATTGIPTLAEVNAALFAALHIYGSFNVTPNQNTGEGPRKLGSLFSPTQLGIVTYPAVDVQYSYKPQLLGTPDSPGNELYEALVPGTRRTVTVLNGKLGSSDQVAANDVANIYLVECGVYREGQTGDGEFDELSTTQALVVVGGEPIAKNIKLA